MKRTALFLVLVILVSSSLFSVTASQPTATPVETWTPIPSRTLPVWTPLPTDTPLPRPTLTPSPTLVSLGLHAFNGYQGRFSPNGQFVLTIDRDKTATLWNINTGDPVQTFHTATNILTAVISPDGKTIVTSDQSASIEMWDAQTGAYHGSIPIPIDYSESFIPANKPLPVWGLEFSPDGKYILMLQSDWGASRFDLATGSSIRLLNFHQLHSQNEFVWAGAVSPDDRYLIISTNKQLVMIDNQDNTIARTFSSAGSIQYSSNGRYILLGVNKGNSTLLELASGKTIRTFQGDHGRLSPDGHYVITANPDGTASLWETESARNLYTFKGTGKPIDTFDFSPDGRYVLISSNGAVSLWDLQTVLSSATQAA